MNRFPPGPPQRHPGPSPYAAPPPGYAPPPPGYGAPPPPGYGGPPPGYGASPPGYGAPPGYGPPPQGYRAPEALVPPPGTEAAVASVVFALIGQSDKRIEAHALEMEKLGAGLQHLRGECNATLNAIRPDTQREYLFNSFLQDARERAEEIRRIELEQLVREERTLQASYQRILDEGLPMISGALDPNQGLPRGFERQPSPRHVGAAPDQNRRAPPQQQEEQHRAPPPAQLRREVIDPRRRPGPVGVQGPPSRARSEHRSGPNAPRDTQGAMSGPAPSVTAGYASMFKRAASKDSAARVEAAPLKEVAESKTKSPVNGPSAPSAPAPTPHDEPDSSPT